MKMITTVFTQNGMHQFTNSNYDELTDEQKQEVYQVVEDLRDAIKEGFANGKNFQFTCNDDNLGSITFNCANLVGISINLVED